MIEIMPRSKKSYRKERGDLRYSENKRASIVRHNAPNVVDVPSPSQKRVAGSENLESPSKRTRTDDPPASDSASGKADDSNTDRNVLTDPADAQLQRDLEDVNRPGLRPVDPLVVWGYCHPPDPCIGSFSGEWMRMVLSNPPLPLQTGLYLIGTHVLTDSYLCRKHLPMFLDGLQLAPAERKVRYARMKALWENRKLADLEAFVEEHKPAGWFVEDVQIWDEGSGERGKEEEEEEETG